MGNEKEIKEKTLKYKEITEKALGTIELAGSLNGKDKKIALDFLEMSKNYFNDGKFFLEKNDLLNALAAFSYAHAWLDAGVRAAFFNAKGDSRLFTLK